MNSHPFIRCLSLLISLCCASLAGGGIVVTGGGLALVSEGGSA